MTFVNKVAESGLLTVDPATFIQPNHAVIEYDLAQHLFQKLVLREKEYREALKQLDLASFQGKDVLVYCSVDAIIPVWAYMLLVVTIKPVAQTVLFASSLQALHATRAEINFSTYDFEQYRDQRVVIKGCADVDVPVQVYVRLTDRLLPFVKSLMYGEPCSTVPLFKRK